MIDKSTLLNFIAKSVRGALWQIIHSRAGVLNLFLQIPTLL